MSGDVAEVFDRDPLQLSLAELGMDAAEPLGEDEIRTQLVVYLGLDRGHVNGVADHLIREEFAHLLSHLQSHVHLRLSRRSTQVRRADDALVAHQGRVLRWLLLEHVEGGTADLAGVEAAQHGGFVDDAAAGAVYQQHAVLALVQLRVRYAVFGLGRQRQMHGDKIRGGEHVLQAGQLGAEGKGCFLGDERIVPEHLHAERGATLSDFAADLAQADDPEDLAGQLDAGVGAALPLARLQRRGGLRDVASQRHEHAEGELSRRYRVATGRVGDDDAASSRRLHVDVVDPGPRPADDPQSRRRADQLLRHLGAAAHDEAVVVADDLQQLVR